ncbi:succinyldiaminopimelate transaminase [Corynebacterium aquilae]|uniref:N-succinyldiaminopimelate aminotransferase n=1 Tax=Corynebacterium aquilae DSM 44791 TaxID=1431546 RepID=A0A1L7CF63_9CORY|nr:succinyldiaminopimelate transaminase [Corynebacterium aquilae]APT84476.1 N-succinyldiaminopimelate aminotransferase [Corynebacterium aquilae DSM 44791]
MERTPLGSRLPDFPWDSLATATATAAAHPDGIVNLSVGTPVDEVAPSIQLALSENAAAPGYPQTVGTQQLRQAIVDALARRYNMTGLDIDSVLPVIGTKEAIAWLPTLLGIGAGHTVVIPEVAYPTYEVSVLMSGATPQRADSLTQIGPAKPTLMFINSPSNPTGKVLGKDHLRKVVQWARERGTILASDECYLGLNWGEDKAYSILDPEVCDGDHTGLIAIHSLSKTSNMASYRSGYFAGDKKLIKELLEIRKHAGLMMPGPIQAATVEALNDDMQEDMQRLRYAKRREILMKAVIDAGFTVDYSDAGLYIWATRGEDSRATVDWFASLGILVAPGEFYGPKGTKHVRIALTASDERIQAAADRLAQAST